MSHFVAADYSTTAARLVAGDVVAVDGGGQWTVVSNDRVAGGFRRIAYSQVQGELTYGALDVVRGGTRVSLGHVTACARRAARLAG